MTNDEKKNWGRPLKLWLGLGLLLVLGIGATLTPGKKTSEYPNVGSTAPDSALLLLAITNVAVPTNNNMLALDFLRQGTNGLATTGYVNAAAVANLWTNSGGIVRLTTNGPVSIASTGLLDGLVVTQDVRILGHNSASNSVWVCTNATTGEGEWRTVGSLASSVGLNPDTNILNIQYEPVRGSTWYSGTNGIPTTNEARAGMEFSPFWRSLRMGQVAGGADIAGLLQVNGSNVWNNTNIGVCTVGFGSNALVKGDFSSVLGGSFNGIRTNARFSVIGGGVDNVIDTNSHTSVIAGGGRNHIRPQLGTPSTDHGLATIGGGSNNVIAGQFSRWSTIGGGGDNLLAGANEATIAGGFGNSIREDGRFGFIGGGNNNQVGEAAGTPSASESSTIGGGSVNIIRGDFGFIGGGRNNNLRATGDDYNVIVGGASNDIGIATAAFSKFCFVGGGHENDIKSSAHYGVIAGGRANNIGDNCTNSVISGGYLNVIQDNAPLANILGGRDNTITGTGDYGTIIGFSNQVSAEAAMAIGRTVTNSTPNAVMVSELISYNTPSVIAGAGSGSTNYTLQVTSPKMLLGSSNVNIVAVMQTIAGKTHNWSVNITNLSADTWGISFSSATNRWKFQSWMYGTNAPSVLTNNTLLRLHGESEGTNTLVTYQYFSPAL